MRDCSKCWQDIRNDVNRRIEAIGEYKRLDWYLVESDSDDDTLYRLCELKNNLEGFNYLSFGELRAEYPERIDRLIYCRNKYYDYVNLLEWSNYDYVIVMDFDGINNKLNKLTFWSSWEKSDWDVVTANQDGPYYDIWALKHKYWNPSDCFQTNDFFLDSSMNMFRS